MSPHRDHAFFDEDLDALEAADAAATGARLVQYLVFTVSGLELGIPLGQVSEVLPYENVSDLPGSPPFIRGVVQVRGRVTPVVDLAMKLGRPTLGTTKRTCILMLELNIEHERLPLGVVMDGVATLMEVDTSAIEKPPRLGRSVEVRALDGIVQTPRGMLPLINLVRVFSGHELERVQALGEESLPSPA